MAKKPKVKRKVARKLRPRRSDVYFDDQIDDTIQGIDQDHQEAFRKAKRGVKPRKA